MELLLLFNWFRLVTLLRFVDEEFPECLGELGVDLATTWEMTALAGDVGDTDELLDLLELGAGAGLHGPLPLLFSLYSYRIQMDPFSPIR